MDGLKSDSVCFVNGDSRPFICFLRDIFFSKWLDVQALPFCQMHAFDVFFKRIVFIVQTEVLYKLCLQPNFHGILVFANFTNLKTLKKNRSCKYGHKWNIPEIRTAKLIKYWAHEISYLNYMYTFPVLQQNSWCTESGHKDQHI